jgi:hypothetical protein
MGVVVGEIEHRPLEQTLAVLLPAPLACCRFELQQRHMIPPSNFALRIVVEEDPILVRSLNARYADAASDGGLETADRIARYFRQAFHGETVASLWRQRRYAALHGGPSASDDQCEVERRFLRRRLMVGRSNCARHLRLSIAFIVLMAVAGCHAQRPGFMTRVREDCAAGQQWACDLLDELSRPTPADDTTPRDSATGRSPATSPH